MVWSSFACWKGVRRTALLFSTSEEQGVSVKVNFLLPGRMTCWAALQTCALLCFFTEICLCYLSFLWSVTGDRGDLLNVSLHCCHVLQTYCSGWAAWCPSRKSGCLASPRDAVWGLAANRRRKPVFSWSHWDLLSLFLVRIGRGGVWWVMISFMVLCLGVFFHPRAFQGYLSLKKIYDI